MFLLKLIKSDTRSFFTILTFGILPALVSSVATYFILDHQHIFENLVWSESVVFFVVTAITMSLALTPSTFIALLSGFFMTFYALPALVLSYLLASWIGLLVGRFVASGKLKQLLNNIPNVPGLMDAVEKNPFGLVLFARLSPIIPFAALNILFGQINIRIGSYLLATLIGMLPRTITFFWIGKNAKDIYVVLTDPNADNYGKLITTALIVVSITGFYFIFMKMLKRLKDLH